MKATNQLFFGGRKIIEAQKKEGNRFLLFSQKKKLHCDDKITQYNNMMMIMRRDGSYYNQHVL